MGRFGQFVDVMVYTWGVFFVILGTFWLWDVFDWDVMVGFVRYRSLKHYFDVPVFFKWTSPLSTFGAVQIINFV